MTTNPRALALKVAQVAQDAGKHALQDQISPRDFAELEIPSTSRRLGSTIDKKLIAFIENRLNYIEPFDGMWRDRPENANPGDRFWCVGPIDGAINFRRNMSEWTITVSLFEFNEEHSAQPILGVVHAPALGLTYLAATGQGAIRIRRTPIGEKRGKVIPSTISSLTGSVVSFGMSHVPAESERAFHVLSDIAGKPADVKRIGPVSLDLCKVADGTYDAYFEPHLHRWDIPAVSAGTVVVRQAQGKVSCWNGNPIHWRSENDIVATNGPIADDLKPYLVNLAYPFQ
ncbi:inositol monophosphatase family protein [Bifidobacterium sp. ESL0798]|uniref:inositol monophosphatase family protein n=1 Tax=unclassified Bifidobacterium TaxID=2608897 RepID=UPI0023F9B2D6|nr:MULTISPECIES: inositol monophosphatase family protein [unclassified Bifidobacterium]WEV53627.1 inositol monophosphatase family protein [Bifidobacterium sp. ESL0704]WEV73405.1 inositol monophosphatase family protein [Bifidobacterium sp. ESL0798]